MDDLLERLTELKVPPAPKSLSRELHQRVNRTLLVQHTIELATQGVIYAGGILLRGFLALVAYTLTGQYPIDRREGSRGQGAGDGE